MQVNTEDVHSSQSQSQCTVNTEDVHRGSVHSAQCTVNTEDVHRVSVHPYPTKAGSVFTSAYIFKWKQRREGWLNRNVEER